MMSQICKECPLVTLVEGGDIDKEGLQNGLFLQVVQGLSGQMVNKVRGTKSGLTNEHIEEIRQKEVKSWGGDVDEAGNESSYLEANPSLAKGVHDCELQIQLGNCAIHSKK